MKSFLQFALLVFVGCWIPAGAHAQIFNRGTHKIPVTENLAAPIEENVHTSDRSNAWKVQLPYGFPEEEAENGNAIEPLDESWRPVRDLSQLQTTHDESPSWKLIREIYGPDAPQDCAGLAGLF